MTSGRRAETGSTVLESDSERDPPQGGIRRDEHCGAAFPA